MRPLLTTAMFAALLACTSAHANDEFHMYSTTAAMTAPGVRDQLDPSVKLYFGKALYPQIAKELGEWRSSKRKVSAFSKPSKEICNAVFLAAALELQQYAKRKGGNAVVSIKSSYKNIERSSESQFICGNNASMVGVTLRGKIVKLAPSET